MKDPKNLTIALLLVSAMFLGLLVFVFQATEPTPAYAGSSESRGGAYIMCHGSWTNSTDVMYVIDIGAQRMNVYFINQNANAVQRVDGVDLKKYFPQNNTEGR